MSGDISHKVEFYKRLDEKRTREGLSSTEEKQWFYVKEELEWASSSAEESPPSSRRSTLRVSTSLEVSFNDSKGFSRAYLRNISEGGVYVETKRAVEMGTRFQLKIMVAQPAKTMNLSVEVVWVNRSPSESSGLKQGIGVAFLDLPPAKKAEIKAIIHHALDDLVRSSVAPAAPVEVDEPEPPTLRR